MFFDFLIIDRTLFGGENDKPTLVFLFNFKILKIFLCLNEMNTHFLYFLVSFNSFFICLIEKVGFISMNKKYLFFELFKRFLRVGTGFLCFR